MKNRYIVSKAIKLFIFTIIIILSIIIIIKNYKLSINVTNLSNETSILHNELLKNSLEFNLMNDCIKMEGIKDFLINRDINIISAKNNEYIFAIYIPLSMDNCSSCINYAINTVKDAFNDFSENKRIVILGQGRNPYLNSRIYKKTIYHEVPDSIGFNSIYNPESKPFYFILNSDMNASMFFIPNSIMTDLTDQYLSIIQKRFFKNYIEDK